MTVPVEGASYNCHSLAACHCSCVLLLLAWTVMHMHTTECQCLHQCSRAAGCNWHYKLVPVAQSSTVGSSCVGRCRAHIRRRATPIREPARTMRRMLPTAAPLTASNPGRRAYASLRSLRRFCSDAGTSRYEQRAAAARAAAPSVSREVQRTQPSGSADVCLQDTTGKGASPPAPSATVVTESLTTPCPAALHRRISRRGARRCQR